MRNVWMTKCMGVKKEMRRTCITLSGLTNFEIKFFLFFFFFLFHCLVAFKLHIRFLEKGFPLFFSLGVEVHLKCA